MGKISMFGLSGSGKTCFLYAMAQVLREGVCQGDDFKFSAIATEIPDQKALNNGYVEMAINGNWPPGSSETKQYDLHVTVECDGKLVKDIPDLTLHDYKGGIWDDNDEQKADNNRNDLMKKLFGSSAILFIVDGRTLLHAMDPNDLDPSHRNVATAEKNLMARQEISFGENMFRCFKEYSKTVTDKNKIKSSQPNPPVLVVVTKSDVFADASELEKGKKLVKKYLPSIFAKGSGIEAGITSVSLGTGLSGKEGEQIGGRLILSTQYNIHLPMVFGLYAILSESYDGSPEDEKNDIELVMNPIRQMMKGKVDIFMNGYPAIIM